MSGGLWACLQNPFTHRVLWACAPAEKFSSPEQHLDLNCLFPAPAACWAPFGRAAAGPGQPRQGPREAFESTDNRVAALLALLQLQEEESP